MRRVTLKDIARKAGVSMMTVSRVLNQKPDVKPQTRRKIESIASEMGYIPNTNARALKGAKSNRIGVVVSDIRNPFYSEMLGELEDMAGAKGISLVIADTNTRLEGEVEAVRSLQMTSVDCLVIAPEGYRTEHLDQLEAEKTRFISFGVHFPEKPYAEVWIDDELGGWKVGRYFSTLGIRKPLLLMGNQRKCTTLARTNGFLNGFASGGGEVSRVGVSHLPVNWKNSEAAALELFSSDTFDGIFCYNDWMAIGALRALKRLKIKPGKDCALVGYDDIPYARSSGLSTVHVPMRPMITTLLDMISSQEKKKVKFEPSLIIRETG